VASAEVKAAVLEEAEDSEVLEVEVTAVPEVSVGDSEAVKAAAVDSAAAVMY
jgi:hypothetical protein